MKHTMAQSFFTFPNISNHVSIDADLETSYFL